MTSASLAWRRHGTWASGITAAALVAALVAPVPGPRLQLVALAAAVLAGLPHGATDLDVARAQRPGRSVAGFVVSYVLAALTVVAGWIIAPLPSLALFLGASAWHFGAADLSPRPRTPREQGVALLRGLSLLALPAFGHPEAVSGVFGLLLGPGGAIASRNLATLAGLVLVVALPVVLASPWVRGGRGAWRTALADLILFAWLLTAPPLLGFALYFALWHAPRHLLRLRGAGLRPRLGPALALSGVVAAATVALVTAVPAPAGMAPLVVQLVFVGLAALTLPHMLQVERPLGTEANA